MLQKGIFFKRYSAFIISISWYGQWTPEAIILKRHRIFVSYGPKALEQIPWNPPATEHNLWLLRPTQPHWAPLTCTTLVHLSFSITPIISPLILEPTLLFLPELLTAFTLVSFLSNRFTSNVVHWSPYLEILKAQTLALAFEAPHSSLNLTYHHAFKRRKWIHAMVFPSYLDPVTTPKQEKLLGSDLIGHAWSCCTYRSGPVLLFSLNVYLGWFLVALMEIIGDFLHL